LKKLYSACVEASIFGLFVFGQSAVFGEFCEGLDVSRKKYGVVK